MGRPRIEFKGEFMLVNGQPIPYEQQMLSKNSLYLTDLGIDMHMEPGVKEFDSRYFNYCLIRLIIKDLEIMHPSVGLQILQELPHLSEKDYAHLFLKLSFTKLKQILMDQDFYLFLWKEFSHLSKSKKGLGLDKDEVEEEYRYLQVPLQQLNEPFKRILYILDNMVCSCPFREALSIAATELIEQVMAGPDFLGTLAETSLPD